MSECIPFTAAVAVPLPVRAYIGLGSNLDDPVRQVRRALAALRELPHTVWVRGSSLYRSRPLGAAAQPDYINAVAVVDTRLDAHALLGALQVIETAHGRDRSAGRWSSRTLDLDLLLYGEDRYDDAQLTVPHPGIAEREFVLYPLAEVEPELLVPGLGHVRDRLPGCDRRGLQRIEENEG